MSFFTVFRVALTSTAIILPFTLGNHVVVTIAALITVAINLPVALISHDLVANALMLANALMFIVSIPALPLGNLDVKMRFALMANLIILQWRSMPIIVSFISKEESRRALKFIKENSCCKYTLEDVQSATRNFSPDLLIGRGGFGKVYKGLIGNKTNRSNKLVAVKRLESGSKQGAKEFRTEIEALASLWHKNLVSLIGFCNEGDEMILVYEYMTHGTLAEHLHKVDKRGKSPRGILDSWHWRLNVSVEIARALCYLHKNDRCKLIHRDLKTSNILLDENWVAKISDFGFSKLSDPASESVTHFSTKVKGTFGYLDPQYYSTMKLTWKSDVYAFGVILFELLSGRRALDRTLEDEQRMLAIWAPQCIRNGKIDMIIDNKIKGQILPSCLREYVDIAERCLCSSSEERPAMVEVVERLECAIFLQGNRLENEKFISLSYVKMYVENARRYLSMPAEERPPIAEILVKLGLPSFFGYNSLENSTPWSSEVMMKLGLPLPYGWNLLENSTSISSSQNTEQLQDPSLEEEGEREQEIRSLLHPEGGSTIKAGDEREVRSMIDLTMPPSDIFNDHVGKSNDMGRNKDASIPGIKRRKMVSSSSSSSKFHLLKTSFGLKLSRLGSKLGPGSRLQRFSMAEIEEATNHFANTMIIDIGSLACIYKGIIEQNRASRENNVAIKCLKLNSSAEKSNSKLSDGTIKIELTSMLFQLHHENLASLKGYCHEEGELILVYDYHNASGTLRSHLNREFAPIPWKRRLQICIGAATALQYLHNLSHDEGSSLTPIILGEFSSDHIFVDDKWIPRVAGYRPRKIAAHGVKDTTVDQFVESTFGNCGINAFNSSAASQLTRESDVFSFGVVLLEVLSARSPINFSSLNMEYLASQFFHLQFQHMDIETEFMDPYLKGTIEPESLSTFLGITKSCLRIVDSERPQMTFVLETLRLALQKQEAEEKKILPLADVLQ